MQFGRKSHTEKSWIQQGGAFATKDSPPSAKCLNCKYVLIYSNTLLFRRPPYIRLHRLVVAVLKINSATWWRYHRLNWLDPGVIPKNWAMIWQSRMRWADQTHIVPPRITKMEVARLLLIQKTVRWEIRLSVKVCTHTVRTSLKIHTPRRVWRTDRAAWIRSGVQLTAGRR